MNYADMKLPELKSEAKAKGIKGFSTMRKDDLISALTALDKPKPVKVESVVDAIKAAIRNAKDARSLAGVAAGRDAKVPTKQSLTRKEDVYRADRNGGKLSARQNRRICKALHKGAPVS